VQTHSGQVRALGTEFNIKTGQKDVTVTVHQHAVRVTAENGKILESLPEGQQVAFSDDDLGLLHRLIYNVVSLEESTHDFSGQAIG